ncbi:Hypothetical protein, putative [Bodo saltans]|uniref:Uncharacterized protein n=1 Tax=Bodo saltans TaxID=75058 RepID=A0A0S4J1P1_BODSA|nr:Hypothetical protein, putative [Bodo saltans]|eukprot:CUG47466.1 Hypothetical protein, putative [Bodo saltans]
MGWCRYASCGCHNQLLPFIEYRPGTYNSTVACRGFPGDRTVSRSLSRPLPGPAPPSPLVPSSAVSTVTTIAGVIGAAAVAAASSALVDAQGLVALGMSVCAPQSLHDATSASQSCVSVLPVRELRDGVWKLGLVPRVSRRAVHTAVQSSPACINCCDSVCSTCEVLSGNAEVSTRWPPFTVTSASSAASSTETRSRA